MRIQVLQEGLYGPQDLAPAKAGDAGIDLRAAEDVSFKKGEEVRVDLGVAMELPKNVYGMLGSRSSTLRKFGVLAQEGKIDSGYRGEVSLVGLAARDGEIKRGDRVAQLLVVKIAKPTAWEIVDSLSESERGATGFGSSGHA